MKRHGSLVQTATSPSNLLPIVGSLLAGLVVALAFTIAVTGCAPDTNGAYETSGRGAQMQPPQGPGVYEIITVLELEPAQLPAVRAVLEEAEDGREEIFASMQPGSDGRPDPSEMSAVRAKTDELKEDTEAQLAELLTAEQMAKYRKMMQEAEQQRQQTRPEMGGRGGGKRPAGGGW